MTLGKEAIVSSQAPAAIGPYSQAIRYGSLLFTSGVLPADPQTGKIPDLAIEALAHLAFNNLAALAQAAGTSLGQTIKVTMFVKDLSHFHQINTVYRHYFPEPFPARSTVQVAALPLDAPLEIEAIIAC